MSSLKLGLITLHMVQTAHLGGEHVKFRTIWEDLGFNWRIRVSNWRSEDDLKKWRINPPVGRFTCMITPDL